MATFIYEHSTWYKNLSDMADTDEFDVFVRQHEANFIDNMDYNLENMKKILDSAEFLQMEELPMHVFDMARSLPTNSYMAFHKQTIIDYPHLEHLLVKLLSCIKEDAHMAAADGHVDAIKFLFKRNFIKNFDFSTIEGKIYALERTFEDLLHNYRMLSAQNSFASILCSLAAESKSLELLKYMRSKGVVWDSWTINMAAYVGSLDCLAYAVEHKCVCTSVAFRAACYGGHSDCLSYLIENKRDVLVNLATLYDNCTNQDVFSMVLKLDDDKQMNGDLILANAIRIGHTSDMVSELMAEGLMPGPKTCERAAKLSDANILAFALNCGARPGRNFMEVAAIAGSTACVELAFNNGCPWTDTCAILAHANGHLDCLKFMVENHCPIEVRRFSRSGESQEMKLFIDSIAQPTVPDLPIMLLGEGTHYDIHFYDDEEITYDTPLSQTNQNNDPPLVSRVSPRVDVLRITTSETIDVESSSNDGSDTESSSCSSDGSDTKSSSSSSDEDQLSLVERGKNFLMRWFRP